MLDISRHLQPNSGAEIIVTEAVAEALYRERLIQSKRGDANLFSEEIERL